MTKTYYAGQELYAPCGRCKDETKHQILSITDNVPGKLICGSCKAVHKFHIEKVKEPKTTACTVKHNQIKHSKERLSPSRFQELMITEKDKINPLPYNVSQYCHAGMWIDHQNFGLGKVQKRLGHKIEVLFRDGLKILISA
jgi:hypothetical protein